MTQKRHFLYGEKPMFAKILMKPVAILIFALSILVPGMARSTTPSNSDAATFISTLVERAAEVLVQEDAKTHGRSPSRLEDLVRESFDMELISRFVVGHFWKGATPRQQSEFRRLFTHYMLVTYASRLAAYRPGSFEVVSANPIGAEDTFVETRVLDGDGHIFQARWRVRGSAGDHKVIDVVIHGVSLLVTKRREFASVIRRDGLDGLLDALRRWSPSNEALAAPETSIAFLLLTQSLTQNGLLR